MTDFIQHITRVVVLPEGAEIFSERATTVEIADEAGGEFVVVSQHGDQTEGRGSIAIEPSEWEYLRAAIDDMVKRCRG